MLGSRLCHASKMAASTDSALPAYTVTEDDGFTTRIAGGPYTTVKVSVTLGRLAAENLRKTFSPLQVVVSPRITRSLKFAIPVVSVLMVLVPLSDRCAKFRPSRAAVISTPAW